MHVAPWALDRELWAGRASRQGMAGSRGGSRPRKTPRPQAVAGRLPRQLAHRSLVLERLGTSLACCRLCCSVPLQRPRETKQSLVLKETQSGLFKEPCSHLEQ